MISILLEWFQTISDDLLENKDLKGLHTFTKCQHNKSLNEMTQWFLIKLHNKDYKMQTSITQLYELQNTNVDKIIHWSIRQISSFFL